MPDPTSEKVRVYVLNNNNNKKERLLSYLSYPLLISVQKYTSIMLETLKVKFDTDINFSFPLSAGAMSLLSICQPKKGGHLCEG